MTSAAEANLDASIRPEISALRARTSYRRRPSDSEPARESSSTAGPGPIRLTRRGRTVVWTLAAVVVAALAAAIWLAVAGQAQASSHARSGAPATGSVRRVVVRQGQTLWGIASQVDPTVDPRVVIPEIVDLNSLNGTGIQAGQVLLVPTS